MGDAIASGGRPESETDTPVNIGNGPYRDNGEGVAARPLPYPLGQAFGLKASVPAPLDARAGANHTRTIRRETVAGPGARRKKWSGR